MSEAALDDFPLSPEERLKLGNQLCFPLYAAAKEVVRRYLPLLDLLGLTYTQYLTMMVLWERETVSVSELGAELYLDSGTLTPLLEEDGIEGAALRGGAAAPTNGASRWLLPRRARPCARRRWAFPCRWRRAWTSTPTRRRFWGPFCTSCSTTCASPNSASVSFLAYNGAMRRIVIIGGGAAGLAAAVSAGEFCGRKQRA